MNNRELMGICLALIVGCCIVIGCIMAATYNTQEAHNSTGIDNASDSDESVVNPITQAVPDDAEEVSSQQPVDYESQLTPTEKASINEFIEDWTSD